MRVIVLASGDLWAGAEVMVYQLVCGLAVISDVNLFVILLNKSRLSEKLEHIGVRVHVVDESRYSFLSIVRVVSKLVTDFSPDIIHSHRYKENILSWLVSRSSSDISLIATQHGMPEVTAQSHTIKSLFRVNIFFRLLSSGFARTVLVSEEMRQALVGHYGFSNKDVNVIHNGIAIPEIVIPTFRNRMVIGSAGRLFPVKGFSLFADIAQLIILQNDTIDFVIAGDGPERAVLEEQVKKYGLGNRFKFLGHQEDMTSFYKGLDVYINTSIHEGIPMSVLEAMSYGLPVVVPKVGGFSEIIEEGVSGYLVDSREPEMFACRILQLLDPELRQSIGSSARERVVASFSREAMAQQYYSLYKELIDNV